MKINSFLCLAVIILCFGLFLACKKSSNSSNNNNADAAANIVGNWKITGLAIDTNKSGHMVSIPVDTFTNHIITTFSANGKVSETYYGAYSYFSEWKLLGNNTYLLMADTTGNNSVAYQIVNLSATNLQIKDTMAMALFMISYAKQ